MFFSLKLFLSKGESSLKISTNKHTNSLTDILLLFRVILGYILCESAGLSMMGKHRNDSVMIIFTNFVVCRLDAVMS